MVVHGRSGSTSYETIPPVRLESSGDVLSTVDMVVQRRDGPRRLRELDDDDEGNGNNSFKLCCGLSGRWHFWANHNTTVLSCCVVGFLDVGTSGPITTQQF